MSLKLGLELFTIAINTFNTTAINIFNTTPIYIDYFWRNKQYVKVTLIQPFC